jgi:hypothetical protein
MRKRIIVNKKDTDYTSTIATEFTTDDSTSDFQEGGRVEYKSIVDSLYRKPKSGSVQDNLTRDDILKRLDNYIPLQTISEKKILTKLPIFKTWVKYFNTQTRQFRVGGLLMKVVYPDYIMLVSTAKNLTWSVQLKDNIIYIPEDIELNDQKQKEKQIEKQKENEIKEKLFKLYKNGELVRKR